MRFSEIADPDQPGAADLAASIDRIAESLRLAKAAYPESDAERWGLSAVQVSRCAKIAAGHLADARRGFAEMVAEIRRWANSQRPPASSSVDAPTVAPADGEADADGDAVEVTTIAVCDQSHRKRGKSRQ
ncbi:MAG TPA: hypothetical protein VIG24_08660 [Acidimicrobiia bacterium]